MSAGQPIPALPLLRLPVPAQHVSGHRQPLAAPAQVGDVSVVVKVKSYLAMWPEQTESDHVAQ